MARGGYRPNSGPKKGTKYKKKGDKTDKPKRKKKSIPDDIQSEADAANMTPLDYMLMVMRDPNADDVRSDRMAIAAAPFIHSRKGEGFGKKEERDERAKKASAGKFAPSSPPTLKAVK